MSERRHKSTYSWRAKLGLIVPPTNTVNEAEWSRQMPDGVTFHTVRMAIHGDTHTGEGRRALVADIATRVRELAEARVDVVAYACTAGSMVHPPQALPAEVEATLMGVRAGAGANAAGIPVVTTAAAIVAALHELAVSRVSIATPYHDALNAHEVEFLAANGIETLRIAGLGLGANGPVDYPLIAQTQIEQVEAHARAALVQGSDALLITCTDFPTLPLVDRLERELGLPVVTSNQATLWASLRRAGITDTMTHSGRIFQRS